VIAGQKNHLGRQQSAHTVSHEHHVGINGLTRRKPIDQSDREDTPAEPSRGIPVAEVISSKVDVFLRSVSRIDLGVDTMGVHDQRRHEIVDVGWKVLEAGLVAHEAVDVDEEQSPEPIVAI